MKRETAALIKKPLHALRAALYDQVRSEIFSEISMRCDRGDYRGLKDVSDDSMAAAVHLLADVIQMLSEKEEWLAAKPDGI